MRDTRPRQSYVEMSLKKARAVVERGAAEAAEEQSFAETLAEAADYKTSSEDDDPPPRPPSPLPGPSVPRELVSRAAIEQSVKMKQVRWAWFRFPSIYLWTLAVKNI